MVNSKMEKEIPDINSVDAFLRCVRETGQKMRHSTPITQAEQLILLAHEISQRHTRRSRNYGNS